MKEAARILLVEDDANLSFLLKGNLEQEGFSVTCSADGLQGWADFGQKHYDLCILDVMLPKQDGFQLCERIRRQAPQVPILFVTARSLKEDVYRGFEAGADDYITKPFTAKELILRIQAILRRLAVRPPASLAEHLSFQLGLFVFDYTLRELRLGGKTLKISTKENELLRLFCESRNTVLSRNRLMVEVWGRDDYFISKSLDVYITRLRKLMSGDPGLTIQNHYSIGYKLVEKPVRRA